MTAPDDCPNCAQSWGWCDDHAEAMEAARHDDELRRWDAERGK